MSQRLVTEKAEQMQIKSCSPEIKWQTKNSPNVVTNNNSNHSDK